MIWNESAYPHTIHTNQAHGEAEQSFVYKVRHVSRDPISYLSLSQK